MKNIFITVTICFINSMSFAASASLFEAGAPQLRIETKINIPKGASGMIFSGGKMTTDFAFTSVCTQTENMCILDTLELAKGRDRYLDVNTKLNLQNLPQACENENGFMADVSTSKNQLRLRCRLSSRTASVDELQALLAGYMTIQYPAKID